MDNIFDNRKKIERNFFGISNRNTVTFSVAGYTHRDGKE